MGTMRWDCKDFFKYLYLGPNCSVGSCACPHLVNSFVFVFFFSRTICWPHLHVKDSFFPHILFYFICLAAVGSHLLQLFVQKKNKTKKKEEERKRCEGNNDQTRDTCKVYWPNKSLYTKKKKVGIHTESLLFREQRSSVHMAAKGEKKNLQDICFYFALNEKCGLKCSNIAIHLE